MPSTPAGTFTAAVNGWTGTVAGLLYSALAVRWLS
jgi:hypothetical protein